MTMSEELKLHQLVLDDTEYATRYTRKFAQRKPHEPVDPGHLRARIPGVVVSIAVQPGRKVRRGDPLLVLEAMKMRNELLSHREGVVVRVHVAPGQMVTKGELLLEIE
jgi:biotin carboxyl carrier protein